jgi:hypothetical protein
LSSQVEALPCEKLARHRERWEKAAAASLFNEVALMRFLLAIAAIFALAALAQAQDEKAILQVWHGFVASSAAYDRCGASDAALKQKFAANYLAVASQAAEQMRAEHPFNPAGDLARALEGRRKAIRAKVEDEIAKNGCTSDGIKELLALYAANANGGATAK